MKTAIYNKVKRLALLFVAGGAMMSSAVAQENLHLFYRNGDHKQIEITDDTKVEFVKKTFLHETSFSDIWGDTIWLSASAGSSGYNGYVRSNQQWSLISDADWMIGYPVYADSLREQKYQKDDNVFYVAALPNSSAQQRTATLTLKTKDGKAQSQYTVVQQPYTMSFEYGSFINNYRYDGQPVVRDTLMLAWDDVESYHYVMPNHGVRVVSYPEWMELDTVAHRGENYDLAWQKENTTLRRSLTTVARFRFAQNFNATARTGEVVFEGSNGQRVTSFVVQEGLNETSVMVTAAKLHQQLYEPNILGNSTHNDFGLPAMMLYLDSRGADMVAEDVGYNWFSHAVRYTDTGASGYPTHIAWTTLYRNIKSASSVIGQYGAQESDPLFRAYLSQAYALRGFDYFYLAQIYQHTYVGNEDAPCLPIVTEDNMEQEHTAGIERASVRDVYAYILENLDKAIQLLEGNTLAFPDKELISLQAARALRARVHLVMNNWQAALADAQRVIDSGIAIPYTMEQVSKPGFNDIDDAAWLWGIKVEETDNAVLTALLNWPAHVCSMSGYGYATTDAGVQRGISKALWVSIPATDVRKGWWVDENLQSPLLVNAYGDAVAAELPYAANMRPYTNVKFGPYNDEPLNATNAQDIPLIRIEEMHLIVAEAQAMLGNTAEAVTTLNNFVSTYRDPAYRCTATTAEQVQEAVWQQRRIELWGEGQAYYDLMRLKKPVDRRGAGFQSNYVFNIPDGDAVRIYQLPSTEMNGNPALVQNPEFAAPQPVEDFEVEIPDPDEGQWNSLGMATYTEDLMTTFFSNVDNVSYEVEIQESVEYPGKYRLVNAYGAAYPYNSDGDYNASKNYYIVIDACNPEKVSIDLSYTGMNWGYGEFYVWSMAQYVMANGGTEDDALPYWGKLENGVITFPAQALVSGMGDEYMSYGNKNGKFSVVLPGYELPQLPTELYMIGQDFGGWDWESEGVVSMTPVHSHEGAFWTTRYFAAGSGFKFCAKRAWDGDFFTLGDDYGFYTDGGNCYVEADGFYTVYVDLVNNIIAVEPAAVYGIGDCFGGWDTDVEANKFVADGRTLVSRATEYDGELRMYVDAPAICDDIDWWMMEFNIYDGAIVYRGAAGDQERVWIAANQQVVLDLNAGTGTLVSPDLGEVYLEEVKYSSYNNDTIFVSASAGRTNSFGWVYCNRPWTVRADAEWLMVRKNESDMYDSNFTSGYEYEDIFLIYAQANETAEERIGHVTIATDANVSKTFVVVQRSYTLSFNEEEYINGVRFDGEPVDTFVIEGAWDWDNIYYNLYPNHGWQVTSYPDWMVMGEFAHGAANCDFETILANEDILAAGQPIISSVAFRFERNESPEPREAHIIFEGHGQKAVGIFRQEGLNEQAIFSGAQALAKKMYIYDEALGMGRHTDYGFPSFMLSMDSRGIDMICGASGYNWYSGNEGFSDLGSNLVYTAQFWNTMYNHIGMANGVIRAYANRTGESLFQFYLGQAYAFRAFNYFYLAQTYQQTYVGHEEAPCVPIITDANMDLVNAEGCPRATVREVYDFILSDLDKALQLLQQSGVARQSKNLVSPEVVYGLRARINMVRGEWAAAAQDAQRVIEAGVAAPYTMDELRAPSLHDINHAAWLWGIDAEETDGPVQTGICNWPSHMGSFSTGYAQVGAWRRVSPALYQAIPDTDVRQGWFLNGQCRSANLSEEQRAYVIDYGMPAYTQVKFAPYNNELGTSYPASDIPLMRVEEMHLILAEAQAMMGDVDAGAKTLINFVSSYRDYAYDCDVRSAEELQEEIWMQRRIEFWGEGHAYFDLMRLGKGVNRRGAGFSEEFTFDIPAGDAALIFPIPDREMNRNPQLEQNPVAEQPKPIGTDEAWQSLGLAVYCEDIVTTFFATSNVVYEVMIEESKENPGVYRLVNPYGAAYPYNSAGDFDTSENHYIEIDARNLEAVSIKQCYTGMDWGYGEFIVWSMADYYLSNGKSAEEVAEAGYFGKLEEGVITFPAGSLIVAMTDYKNGGLYAANKDGKFSLVLPGYDTYSRSRERSVKESKLHVRSRELVTDLDAKLQVK